jgi:hypothetical protein
VCSSDLLLATTLPKLQQAGVQVHTIALSEQSDVDLMRQIALTTNGWNELAQNS